MKYFYSILFITSLMILQSVNAGTIPKNADNDPRLWRRELFRVVADRKHMSLGEFSRRIDSLMNVRATRVDSDFLSATETALNEALILLRPGRMEKYLQGNENVRSVDDLNQQLFIEASRVFRRPKLERHTSSEYYYSLSSNPGPLINPDKHISLNDAFRRMAAFQVDLNDDTHALMEVGQLLRQLGKEDLQRVIIETVSDSTDATNRVLQNIPSFDAAVVSHLAASVAGGTLNTPKLVHGIAKSGRVVTGIIKSREASDISREWETIKRQETFLTRGQRNYKLNPNFPLLDKRYGITDAIDMIDIQRGMRTLALDKNILGQADFIDVLTALDYKMRRIAKQKYWLFNRRRFEELKKSIVNEAIQLLRPEVAAKLSQSPETRSIAAREMGIHSKRGTLNQFTQVLLDHAANQGINVHPRILAALEASQVTRSQSNWAKHPAPKNAKLALQIGFGINAGINLGASLAGVAAVSTFATPLALGGLAISALPAVARTVKGIQNTVEMSETTENYKIRLTDNLEADDTFGTFWEDNLFG